MNKGAVLAGLAAALLLSGIERPRAEDKGKDKDPVAVLMLGVEGDVGFPGGKSSRGPSAAVEFNVIKDWLEIEMGGAKLFRSSKWEWENEIVFRKPFTLSETTEVMVGLGPMWSKAKGENGKVGTTFVADFMFWSSPERKYGWFIEPSYSLNPGNDQSFAVSVGLLIGFH